MDNSERREKILKSLRMNKQPITATFLANQFGVSRQVIVGDVAIIRAMGIEVFSTPRGYILPVNKNVQNVITTIACRHNSLTVEKELAIIINHGGKVRDVIVEHPLYGEIRADLFISSQQDLKNFLEKMSTCGASPLLIVTDGLHLHTIEVPDEQVLEMIKEELRAGDILVED